MNVQAVCTNKVRRVYQIAFLAGLAIFHVAANGQGYPSKPIRFIVPFGPGGSVDLIARRFSEQLSSRLKQPVVIENRPGAGSNIGSEIAAQAAPDGYTLLLGTSQLTAHAIFGPFPKFDLSTALVPVSMIVRLPFIMAAGVAFPFESIEQLIPAARKNPGKFTIASAQLETLVELMKLRANFDVLHVPYKQATQSIIDTIAGRVDMTFNLGPILLPQVRGGKLKPLGVAGRQRLEIFASTPTFADVGVDYEAWFWCGLLAPAGTPQEIVDRLAAEARSIIESPGFASYLRDNGGFAHASGPAEMRELLRKELAQWRDLARMVPRLVQSE